MFDINLKDAMEKQKGANAEAEKQREEAEKQFASMKGHYDAGTAAIEQMKAAQAQLAAAPKDQQDPIKAKINEGRRHGRNRTQRRAGSDEAGRYEPPHHIVQVG